MSKQDDPSYERPYEHIVKCPSCSAEFTDARTDAKLNMLWEALGRISEASKLVPNKLVQVIRDAIYNALCSMLEIDGYDTGRGERKWRRWDGKEPQK